MNDTRIKHNNKLKSEHKDGIAFQLVVEFGNWAVLKLQLFLNQIVFYFEKLLANWNLVRATRIWRILCIHFTIWISVFELKDCLRINLYLHQHLVIQSFFRQFYSHLSQIIYSYWYELSHCIMTVLRAPIQWILRYSFTL